ncbi:MAG TPA: superoxide dismutase family protein, partial [Bacteroidales bacterium]|nr:superoxide dismutase family protein [Bacteroidales bacterium]
RSVIIHVGEDDLVSQPTGDAGGRVAQGVIGVIQ